MKGTVAVETATKGKDGREDVVSLQEGKQNDTPKLDATNIENTDENTDEAQKGHSETYRNDMNSHRSVIVGDQEKLQLDWRVSEWSRCSQTCGEDGRQVKIKYHNAFRIQHFNHGYYYIDVKHNVKIIFILVSNY